MNVPPFTISSTHSCPRFAPLWHWGTFRMSLNCPLFLQTFTAYLKFDAFTDRSIISRFTTFTLLHVKLWKYSQGSGPYLRSHQFSAEIICHHQTWFWWCYTVSTIRASWCKPISGLSHDVQTNSLVIAQINLKEKVNIVKWLNFDKSPTCSQSLSTSPFGEIGGKG